MGFDGCFQSGIFRSRSGKRKPKPEQSAPAEPVGKDDKDGADGAGAEEQPEDGSEDSLGEHSDDCQLSDGSHQSDGSQRSDSGSLA